jgi:CheY-like chemotaxis protein
LSTIHRVISFNTILIIFAASNRQMNRTILMLEHDDDDRYITQTVIDENQFPVTVHFVTNSNALFSALQTWDVSKASFPSLILVNYHAMPLNAVEILKKLKSDQAFAHIPVVVLSGSANPEVVRACYGAGASSFIRKPSTGKDTDNKISTFIRYWFSIVELG